MSGALAAFSAPAFGGACGLISTTAVTKAFHMSHAAYRTLLYMPPKYGGEESLCDLSVWSGSEPTTEKRIAGKLARGKLASLVITTWMLGTGLYTPEGAKDSFTKTLAMFTDGAQASLVTTLHGKSFAPPALGAEAVGYRAKKGPRHVLVGIWSKPTIYRLLTVSITEGKTSPLLGPLKTIAATAVPAFGL